VSTRSLRARLDRLMPSALSVIGQDRDRDRRRRYELFCRKICPIEGLTRLEEAEYAQLEASFQEEDRDRDRRFELNMKEFKREPLTDAEQAELVELDKRYPPDPNDPLKPFWEACGAVVLALDRESKE
jgi:hypothetical protein